MSAVKFTCPHCGESFSGDAGYIGMEADCPNCGQSFKLESSGTAPNQRPNGLLCYFLMFRKYAVFRGRTPRREFWWAFLFHLIVILVTGAVGALIFDTDDPAQNAISAIYALVSLLPMISLHFRRLHDTNKSGWWWLILPLPVVNLAYIVWLMTDGDKGENRFGQDQKHR